MSIIFTTFALKLGHISTSTHGQPIGVEEVKVVEKSPSQHGKVKDTISRAEVIGA